MILEENCRELITINTHKGLYRYTQLPFGVTSASDLFQKAIDTIFQGTLHVIFYSDDICVTGSSDTERLHNLEKVLRQLKHLGIQVKRAKCVLGPLH